MHIRAKKINNQKICRRKDGNLGNKTAIVSHTFLWDSNAISTLRERDSHCFNFEATSHENLQLKQFSSVAIPFNVIANIAIIPLNIRRLNV